MKQGILYNGCSTTQALGLGSNGQPAMVPIGDDSAQWQMMPGFSQYGVPLGIALRNVSNGLALTAYGGNLACGPVAGLTWDVWSTWDVGTSLDRYKPFRPVADTDLNISTGICDAGAVPALRGWDGNQPTSTGRSSPIRTWPTSASTSSSLRNAAACLRRSRAAAAWGRTPCRCSCSPRPTTPRCGSSRWATTRRPPSSSNQATTLVGANVLDLKSTWNFGSGSGGSTVAIRPQYDDTQNLNVFGGCASGSPTVGTYTWSDGKSNEVWTFSTPQQSGANRTG